MSRIHRDIERRSAEAAHERVMRMGALAGRVLRYHTWVTLHRQTVGEHSARVAMLYIRVYGLPRAEVLAHVLQHDLGELNSGDVPFYAKRQVPELAGAVNAAEKLGLAKLGLRDWELTDEEYERFKSCDLLEMFEFGLIEERMGNSFGRVVSDNVRGALEKLVGETRAAEMMLMIMMEVRETSRG